VQTPLFKKPDSLLINIEKSCYIYITGAFFWTHKDLAMISGTKRLDKNFQNLNLAYPLSILKPSIVTVDNFAIE
jgi:hypothetical protein